MSKTILLPTMRFRFTEPEDVEQYGDQWTPFDERAFFKVPARDLIEVEQTIGMSILSAVIRSHAGYTDGTLACLWLARKLDGVVEDFEAFAPVAQLVDWAGPEDAPAADADPPASGSGEPAEDSPTS